MSMTLKESFRYQNFLDTILGQAELPSDDRELHDCHRRASSQ